MMNIILPDLTKLKMPGGDWMVRTYDSVTGFIFFIARLMTNFLHSINVKIPIVALGRTYYIPIMSLIFCALIISFVASVFVKGAKG